MLNSIQTLRAIAAWLVVGHHYMQLAHNFQFNDIVSVWLHRYGAIGVDLFFIISGFVIYSSTTGKHVKPTVFAAHRLARIVPAYWLFTLLTALTLIFMPNAIPLTQFETLFSLKSLLFVPAQNPSGIGLYPLITVGWTLNYEMAFYAVFMVSLLLPAKYKIPAIALGVFLLCKATPTIGALSFYNNPIVFEFLFGVLIAYAHQRGLVQRTNSYFAFLMTAGSVLAISYFGQITHSPIKTGIPCAVILFAVLSQERFFSGGNTIRKLGDWSYSTYLCHVLVISLMLKLQNLLDINGYVVIVIIVAAILCVSGLSFNFIEKPISHIIKTKKKTLNPARSLT